MIEVSVNELETLVRKAAVGAGIDHGYASEAAQSLVWLAAAGVDCLPGLAGILAAWSEGRTGPVAAHCQGRTCTLAAAPGTAAGAVYAAPAVRDFTALMLEARRFDEVRADNVEAPWLVLGRLAREPWRRAIEVACREPGSGGTRWTAWLPAAPGDGDTRAEGEIAAGRAGDLRVRLAPETPADASRGLVLAADTAALCARRLNIEPADYDALKQFFNATLVPDSEASRRHGAGAGLVDSD